MIWKTIEELPMYEISDDGRVRNATSKRLLTPQEDKNGYLKVWFYGGTRGKTIPRFVHRLVARAFVEGYYEGAQVNHKDENKKNNCFQNLEWCSCKHNINYGTRTERAIAHHKMPVEQLRDGVVIAIYPSTQDAQRATGIWQQNISKCCNGRKNFKTAGGYQWRYAK
jgi:hypothetical protein